jgi:predicted NACHT family NTPase
LEVCGIEQFERLALGRSVRTVSGLDAVRSHQQLMVLGKPGAGKTTFLKYLAMRCVTGEFAANSVPFFVTLKDFAEAPKQPSLVEYLVKSLPTGWSIETIEQLLAAGRAIVLLDGLDEVRKEDTKRVNREVRSAVDAAQKSQFIMTCRIAAKEYTFVQFTEVEVADFDDQQIETFVENWFRSKNDLSKAKRFIAHLEENESIRELAASPLLLTLLCLVFGEEGDFPSNRSDLYAEGVKVLLKKWDAKRNIQRDDHYKKAGCATAGRLAELCGVAGISGE